MENYKANQEDVAAKFCGNTSLHGFGQVPNEKSTKMKIFWKVIIVLACIGLISHMTMTIVTYTNYGYDESSQLSSELAVFPFVTICNMNALSSMQEDNADETITSEIESYKANLIAWEGMVNTQIMNIPERLTSAEGYFANLNLNTSQHIGHQLEQFVIYCRFQNKNCNFSDFELLQDPMFLNCYTFKPISTDSVQAGQRHGLMMILYTESKEAHDNTGAAYVKESVVGNGDGVRIVIHEPNTHPAPVDQGVSISPGQSTDISLSAGRTHRLGQPYSDCSSRWPAGIQNDMKNYHYTQFSCQSACRQKAAHDQCKRSTPDFINLNYDIPSFFHINLSNPRDVFDKEACIQENIGIETVHIREGCTCFWACDEATYATSVSMSHWPQDNLTPLFVSVHFACSQQTTAYKMLQKTMQFDIYQKLCMRMYPCPGFKADTHTLSYEVNVKVSGVVLSRVLFR